MPKWGLTMEEGILGRWLKRVGDPVEEREPLFTAETDKAESDVESPASGVLAEILVEEGTAVPPGTPVARIYSLAEWQGRHQVGS